MASLSAFAMGVEEMSEPRTHHGVAGALSHSYVPKSKLIDLVLMHQNSTIPFVNFSSLCKLFNAAEVTTRFSPMESGRMRERPTRTVRKRECSISIPRLSSQVTFMLTIPKLSFFPVQ